MEFDQGMRIHEGTVVVRAMDVASHHLLFGEWSISASEVLRQEENPFVISFNLPDKLFIPFAWYSVGVGGEFDSRFLGMRASFSHCRAFRPSRPTSLSAAVLIPVPWIELRPLLQCIVALLIVIAFVLPFSVLFVGNKHGEVLTNTRSERSFLLLVADTTSQLHISRHDRHTLGVNSAQVGILEQRYQVSLSGLLESHHSGALETQVVLEILSNLTHQTLEGQLADQQLGALLILADLTKSHRSGSVTMGLLHGSGSGGRLAGSLGSQLLAGDLSSGTLTSSLLGTSHSI